MAASPGKKANSSHVGEPASVGIIIGSTRPNCNGKTIALWVEKLIQQEKALHCRYKVIDLAEWNLPLFNEPGIPMLYPASLDHSKAWSSEVRSLDGFLFITPQVTYRESLLKSSSQTYLCFCQRLESAQACLQ